MAVYTRIQISDVEKILAPSVADDDASIETIDLQSINSVILCSKNNENVDTHPNLTLGPGKKNPDET